MNKDLDKQLKPTGNLWMIEEMNSQEVTVPIPTPVIMVKVEGAFKERERKLWTFLIHAVWDDLETKRIHELPVSEVAQIFRKLGGDRAKSWLWDSVQSLSETKVTFEGVKGDVRYKGISRLISAVILTEDESRKKETLQFEFPAALINIIKEPYQYARLRTHYLITLSGKYSVTLYEILEGLANRTVPKITVPVEQLRVWLKVPEGKLSSWGHFYTRCLKPALDEINKNPIGAGFTVNHELIKGSRDKVEKVSFEIIKTSERKVFEEKIKKSEKKSILIPQFRGTTYLKAKKIAPGLDIYSIEAEWKSWLTSTGKVPDNYEASFIWFCKKKAQNSTSINLKSLLTPIKL